jgi:polyphosphate kinase
VLDRQDVLVHHPYDSFSASVEEMMNEAADDPHVLAIKQCLYRTSGDSPVVAALVRAAEHGKQVAVLVEVTARFDEEANIGWARALEEAGAHVIYGLMGLKTHAKTTLVVRQKGAAVRLYCHVGTGNYNPKTARMYEDLGILSCRPALGADVTRFFNYITGFSQPPHYQELVTSPGGIRNRVLECIDKEAEAGPDGRIAGPVRDHHGALHRGAVPRAFAYPPLRRGGRPSGQLLHRVRRSASAQSRPEGRGDDSGR